MATRRPPNRKALIRATAGELFLTRGYHNVSVTDVADALGITPSALYHHYRNKQELLFHAVLDALDGVDILLVQAGSLDQALAALARLVLGPRSLAVWEREARNLEGDQREQIRAREAEVVGHVVPLLRQERTELDPADGALIARAIIGAMGSRAQHRLSLPRPVDEQLMIRLGRNMAHCRLSAAAVAPRPERRDADLPVGFRPGRRDVLLTEAVRLFDERGFRSVTMADIGEAVGIVASGVYRHFPGKTDLLVAAAQQAGERMRVVVDGALAAARDPQDALERLLAAHISIWIESQHLVGILANDADELPEPERRALRRFQNEYIDIWVRTLQAARPGPADPTELRIIVHAVHSMVYFVVRDGRSAADANLATRLQDLGLALLQDV